MITKTVFFVQHQGYEADFSDGSTDLKPLGSLDEGVSAFKKAAGHRRLLALSVDFFTEKPQGMAVELARV